MIIPKHWARADGTANRGNRDISIRRYGWSETSLEEAQEMADDSLEYALDEIRKGKSVWGHRARMGYQSDYEGPIREEVIGKTGDSVLTRNNYGAVCLNTPEVVFADIDFEPSLPLKWLAWGGLLGAALGMMGALALAAPEAGTALCSALAAFIGAGTAGMAWRRKLRAKGGLEAIAMAKIKAFSEKHPDWHMRIYETFGGLRVLVLHATMDPRGREVSEFFRAIDTDPLYARMCVRQGCFRARLTPKPWRIGLERMNTGGANWPAANGQLEQRKQWVVDYDRICAHYSTCRLLETLGPSDRIDKKAGPVLQLHDTMTRTSDELPLA